VLEKIEGDPNSDYINASYMPVSDALSFYSAGQSLSVTLVIIKTKQGCHRSGNGQGKKSFKVREKSGNFILGQKLTFFFKFELDNLLTDTIVM